MSWIHTKRAPIFLLLILAVAATTAVLAVEASRSGSGEVTFTTEALNYSFALERDGAVVGYFSEVTGLGSETDVVEFRDGQDPSIIHKVPGQTRYHDVTLKRGGSADLMAWDWREQVIQGQDGFRASVRITMLRWDGRTVAAWDLINAWPKKITGPVADADGNSIAIEELVLVCEGLRRRQ